MIAHSVARNTKDSFGRLANYAGKFVGTEQNTELSNGWGNLANYAADTAQGGQKVATNGIRFSNFPEGVTLQDAIDMVETRQEVAGAAEKDRNYHLVISFPPGEVPTKEQLEDIEDELVRSIGLQEHERVSAIHTDQDHLHIHVAINKVHPVTLKVNTPYRDHPKLMAACKVLEVKHDLQQTHADKAQMPDGTTVVTGKAADMEARTGEKSLQRWIKENAKDDLVKATSWEELHKVAAENGLMLKKQGNGFAFVTTSNKQVAVKASDVDRSLSAKKLQEKLGPFRPGQKIETPENQAPNAEEAENNQAQDGNEEGAGINGASQPEQKSETKQDPRKYGEKVTLDEAASEGMFEEDAVTLGEAKRAYVREPIQKSPEAEALWQAYQQRRESAPLERAARLSEIKAEAEARKEAIKKNTKAFRESPLNTRLDKDLNREKDGERYLESRLKAAGERKETYEETRAPNWYEFLKEEVSNGNTDALNILRQITKRRDEYANNILRAVDWDEGKTIVLDTAKKTVSNNGTVRYFTNDGGSVADRVDYIGVQEVSVGSAALALVLASERFDRPLTVTGTDEFKKAVAAAAALPESHVTFADPEMERMRLDAIREREEAQSRYSAQDTFLFVPPQDKAEVKGLGARWDAEVKRWKVPAKADLEPFEKWRKVAPGADLKAPGTPLIVPFEFKEFVKEAGAQWDEDSKGWVVPSGVRPEAVGLGDFVAETGRYATEKTFLHVPMADKEEAKELGARWDSNAKLWFVPAKKDLQPFADWRKSVDELVEEFVEEQKATTDDIYIIKKHRAWANGDTEEGKYAGIVELTPRMKAALIETDSGILVKPLTQEEAQKMQNLTHGEAVTVTAKGHLNIHSGRGKGR